MLDTAQVKRSGSGYQIVAPYTAHQLTMIYKFLAPEPEGRGFFDNFVLDNSRHSAYLQLDENAKNEKMKMVTDVFLFDLWSLMIPTLAEVCGCNRNWILFERDTLKSTEMLDPDSIEISKNIFYKMASQLIGEVRRINGDIPVVSNNFVLMNNGPRVVP